MGNIKIIRGVFDTKLELEHASVMAGFPSPAEDYRNETLDFNRDYIKHPEASFYGDVSACEKVFRPDLEGKPIVVLSRSRFFRTFSPVPTYYNHKSVSFCPFSLEYSKYFLIFAPININSQTMSTQVMTQQIAEYFKTQPVLKAWIFGSYARGEQTAESDIDILIQPDKSVGLFKLSGMHLDLQELLNLEVDLVTVKGLRPFARESADRDKILIYERAS